MARMGIGEFARASGLTPKALRIYDELGLLAPAAVDPWSGYRSYDPSQLARARLIAALRGVGMPLARIRVVCELRAGAATVEVRSWWRQVEADVRARSEQVCLLVDDIVIEEDDMITTRELPELDHGARSDRGLVRESNEDVVFAGTRLFAVADGFGAQGRARTASVAAVEALAAVDGADAGDADPVTALATAVRSARTAVAGFARDAGIAPAETGTTLTALLWSGTSVAVAHVGDSRLYLLRDGELTRITHDHTYVQSLVEEGRLTPEEATAHPERATLLRALTADDPTAPDLHLRESRPGDRYLLCSDGLHAVLGDDRLRNTSTGARTAARTADELVEAAREAGAPDNVACVVVDVVAHR